MTAVAAAGAGLYSPHGAVAAVGVAGGHGAHLGAGGRVLVHVQDVVLHGEDGRLVHVAHGDLERGGVLEGAQVGEARVRVRVGALDVQRVRLLPLVVQRLAAILKCVDKTRTKRNNTLLSDRDV